MNGKNIPFPNILDNELLEDFNIYQKHVRVQRMMHLTFEKGKLDPNCMILQVDFAMTYSCEYQNEIQCALWSR